mgnify:CR=1 FL=1
MSRLKVDEIVIGYSLEAVTYSFLKNVPIIINSDAYFIHKFCRDLDYGVLGWRNEKTEVITVDGAKEIGLNEFILKRYLLFFASVGGLVWCAPSVKSIRLSKRKKEIKLTSMRNVKLKVSYDKLTIFNDERIMGLGIPEMEKITYVIYDWLLARSEHHEFDYLTSDDDLVSDLWFYPPGDEALSWYKKEKTRECVAVSFLNKKDIYDPDYGEGSVRLKVMDMMDDVGISGSRGRKHPKIEHVQREFKEIRAFEYEPMKHITFNDQPLEEILLLKDGEKALPYAKKFKVFIDRFGTFKKERFPNYRENQLTVPKAVTVARPKKRTRNGTP